MKKHKSILLFLAGMVVGGVISAIFVSIVCFEFCPPKVVTPLEGDIGHFGTNIPEGSSKHYFYRTGFRDVDEYWSFDLPPEKAQEFIKKLVSQNSLEKVTATGNLPSWIIPDKNSRDWRPGYWFENYSDLSEIHYKKYYFLGYSAQKNRIYLLNWND